MNRVSAADALLTALCSPAHGSCGASQSKRASMRASSLCPQCWPSGAARRRRRIQSPPRAFKSRALNQPEPRRWRAARLLERLAASDQGDASAPPPRRALGAAHGQRESTAPPAAGLAPVGGGIAQAAAGRHQARWPSPLVEYRCASESRLEDSPGRTSGSSPSDCMMRTGPSGRPPMGHNEPDSEPLLFAAAAAAPAHRRPTGSGCSSLSPSPPGLRLPSRFGPLAVAAKAMAAADGIAAPDRTAPPRRPFVRQDGLPYRRGARDDRLCIPVAAEPRVSLRDLQALDATPSRCRDSEASPPTRTTLSPRRAARPLARSPSLPAAAG